MNLNSIGESLRLLDLQYGFTPFVGAQTENADITEFTIGEVVFREPINEQEKENVKKKHGNCWECVGLNMGNAGYTYAFKFISKENNKFPALEIDPVELADAWNTDPNVQIFKFLGYSFSNNEGNPKVYFYTAPDLEELLCRWNLLRQLPEHKELPELSIKSVNGISSDREFVGTFCSEEADGTLSIDKEFLHDHQVHIYILIKLLLSVERENSKDNIKIAFDEDKKWMKGLVKKRLNDLDFLTELLADPNSMMEPNDKILFKSTAPQLMTVLAVIVDSDLSLISDANTLRQKAKSVKKTPSFLKFSFGDWYEYFYGDEGRYKKQNNPLEVIKAWENLSRITNKYRIRNKVKAWQAAQFELSKFKEQAWGRSEEMAMLQLTRTYNTFSGNQFDVSLTTPQQDVSAILQLERYVRRLMAIERIQLEAISYLNTLEDSSSEIAALSNRYNWRVYSEKYAKNDWKADPKIIIVNKCLLFKVTSKFRVCVNFSTTLMFEGYVDESNLRQGACEIKGRDFDRTSITANFINDQPVGIVKTTNPNFRATYEGGILEEEDCIRKHWYRHGAGAVIKGNGEWYRGTFSRDSFLEGIGSINIYRPVRGVYTGQLGKGKKRCGKGTFTPSDGSEDQRGIWKDDILVKEKK